MLHSRGSILNVCDLLDWHYTIHFVFYQVNLRWLDLSFNAITKVEGLESLDKLQDLSLYCNAIEVVEGLDRHTGLEALSLGELPPCPRRGRSILIQ